MALSESESTFEDGDELGNWPVTIDDAPIRCGLCDKPIMGSGTGTVWTLVEAVKHHAERCEWNAGGEGCG